MRRESLVFCLLVFMVGGCASSAPAPQGRDLGGGGGGGDDIDLGVPDLAPPADLKKAGFGEPCSDASQCETNICVFTSKGGVCTDFCPAIGCPAMWGCYDVLGAIDPGQVARVCVPEPNVLCTPCSTHAECGAPSGADKCLTYPSGKFCARDCSRISCPATFTCKTVDDGTGNMTEQCVPDNDACDCNASTLGRTIACTISTVNGACTGMRTCNGTTGWGACMPPSATDAPDLNFQDTNCDGIDGTEANAIFVDVVTGNDANPGTKAMPKRTIQAGIDAAAAGTKKEVYISKGTYSSGTIILASGVSLYGGYDAAMNWKRSAANLTRISSTSTTAVASPAGNPRLNAIELQLLTITARGTTTAGASSYGIRIANGVGLTVRGCDITAGDAGNGSPGAKGSTGAKGGDGGDAVGTTGGLGGTSPCGVPGGNGASGINSDGGGAGNSGSPGTSVALGGGAGSGGAGGSSGSCDTTSSSSGGNAPTSTAAPPFGPFPGSPGGPGQNGSAGAALGSLDSSGNYTPATGGNGLSSGAPGGGGGGGGSGGGSANGTNGTCTNCSAIPSGGGGGGGAGGCGGGVGAGGRGGGGSFAIAASGTPVTVEDTSLSTGFGGNGGDGGDGGDGGQPGAGGSGAVGGARSGCCVCPCFGGCCICGDARQAGDGAPGRQGGSGGRGGAGAGGPGGPSICVYYKGTPANLTRTTCVNGGAGGGGMGGTNGQFRAPSGAAGVSDVVRASP
jgi:hypothetical protein